MRCLLSLALSLSLAWMIAGCGSQVTEPSAPPAASPSPATTPKAPKKSESPAATDASPAPRAAEDRPVEPASGPSACITVNDANFRATVLDNPRPVLVFFCSPASRACKELVPTVESLAREYAGRIVVAQLDTTANSFIVTRYRVNTVPTFVLFRMGHPLDLHVGAMSEAELREMLDLGASA